MHMRLSKNVVYDIYSHNNYSPHTYVQTNRVNITSTDIFSISQQKKTITKAYMKKNKHSNVLIFKHIC